MSSRATSARRFGTSSTATSRWATPMCACSSSKGASPRSTTCSPIARDSHRGWIETTFAPFLPARRARREELVLTLYAATDVTVWKLLRRDLGCSRAKTEAIIRNLVEGATGTLDPIPRGLTMTNTSCRYLLPMWDGGGTVAPGLGVARRLIARGHSVHVLADPTIRTQAEQAGLHVHAVGAGTPPHVARPRPGSAPRLGDGEPAGDARLGSATASSPGRPRRSPPTPPMPSTSSAPTSSCPTTCCSAPSWRPQAARLPVVPIVPNIWTLPSPGVPAIGPGFPLAKGLPGRCRDAALRATVNALFRRGLPPLNAARTARGLPPLRSFYDQVLDTEPDPRAHQPELRLRLAVRARQRQLHRSRSSTSRRGPSRGPDPSPQTMGDPLVLVGFSSTYQQQAPLLQRVVDGLSSLPVRGIVTLGPTLHAGDVHPVSQRRGRPVGAARPDPA